MGVPAARDATFVNSPAIASERTNLQTQHLSIWPQVPTGSYKAYTSFFHNSTATSVKTWKNICLPLRMTRTPMGSVRSACTSFVLAFLILWPCSHGKVPNFGLDEF